MAAETTEKIYTFRRLTSADVFPMLSILSKIGVNEFTECLEKENIKAMLASIAEEGGNEKAASLVGVSAVMEIANVLFRNLPKCENEIFKLLASTSNLTEKAIRELDLVVFAEMVIDFIKKEEFPDFIKVVSKLLK